MWAHTRPFWVLVGLALSSSALQCHDMPRQSAGGPQYAIGQEVEAEGTVTENVLGCKVDGTCYVRLMTSAGEVVVVYATPRGATCMNEKATLKGMEIRKGERIRAFARAIGHAELSTCDDQKYFFLMVRKKEE